MRSTLAVLSLAVNLWLPQDQDQRVDVLVLVFVMLVRWKNGIRPVKNSASAISNGYTLDVFLGTGPNLD